MLIVLVQIDNRAYTDGASQSIQDFDSAPCIYMFSVHAVLTGSATSEMELIEVGYHGAGQSIRDFDSAIAYIFSVQAVLAGDATSEGHFDPSLLVLGKVLKLLTAYVTGLVPITACLVPREKEGMDTIERFFGACLYGRDDSIQRCHLEGSVSFRKKCTINGMGAAQKRSHHLQSRVVQWVLTAGKSCHELCLSYFNCREECVLFGQDVRARLLSLSLVADS